MTGSQTLTQEQRLRLARALWQVAAMREEKVPDLAPEGESRADLPAARRAQPKTPARRTRSRSKCKEQPLDPIVEAEARRRLREAFEQAQG